MTVRALVIGLLVGACAHAPQREPPLLAPIAFQPSSGCVAPTVRTLPPERASDTLSASGAKRDPHAGLAYAARQLPGGYTEGPLREAATGRLVLWLRDPQARDTVLAGLAGLPWQAAGAVVADSVVARASEWDAAALYDWMTYIETRLTRDVGVNGWSIRSRRVYLDLETRAAISNVVTFLQSLGVPCDLVVYSVRGPIRMTSRATHRVAAT